MPKAILVTIDDITDSLLGHARRLGLHRGTLSARRKRGLSPKEALTAKKRAARLVRIGDEDKTVAEAAAMLGVSKTLVESRLKRGKDPTTPPKRAERREHEGEMLTARETAKKLGISYQAVYLRWETADKRRGQPDGVRRRKRYAVGGEMLTIAEIAARVGACEETIKRRRTLGEPLDAPLKYKKTGRVLFRGEMLKPAEIAARTGLSEAAIRSRLRTGKPIDSEVRRRVEGARTKPNLDPAKPPKTSEQPKRLVLDGIEATIAEHAERLGTTEATVRIVASRRAGG